MNFNETGLSGVFAPIYNQANDNSGTININPKQLIPISKTIDPKIDLKEQKDILPLGRHFSKP